MTELSSIYDKLEFTLAGYRAHDGIEMSRERINDWAKQFTEPWVDLPATGSPGRKDLLRAVADELERTYWSEERIKAFLRRAILHPNLSGADPLKFWRQTTVLGIQRRGESQRDMLRLLDEALREELLLSLEDCASDARHCLYVDDGLFTGNRMIHDITDWVASGEAPDSFDLKALFLVSHTNGERWVRKQLEAARADVATRLTSPIQLRAHVRVRNLVAERNQSGVLWPTFEPPEVAGPWRPRTPIPGPSPGGFTTNDNREMLETYLLQAGAQICGRMRARKPYWRPLGFSHFAPGFGSMFATYRNCPNNAPLALWWDLNWSPLLPRVPKREPT